MFQSNKDRRSAASVNAGSMADIAFLLLIFFLVTTTILEDEGIKVRLPPYVPDQPITPVNDNNVLSVKINGQDELLIEGEEISANLLKSRAKEFLINPQNRSDLPSSPKKAVISLQNDRGTTYQKYIEVYNELKAAYAELWEEAALKAYAKSYEDLNIIQQRAVKKEIPLVISEADPTDHLLATQ